MINIKTKPKPRTSRPPKSRREIEEKRTQDYLRKMQSWSKRAASILEKDRQASPDESAWETLCIYCGVPITSPTIHEGSIDDQFASKNPKAAKRLAKFGTVNDDGTQSLTNPHAILDGGIWRYVSPIQAVWDELLTIQMDRLRGSVKFVTGPAGSGKTHRACEMASTTEDGSDRKPKNIIIAAASGQAAARLRDGGDSEILSKATTVHAACKMGISGLPKWLLHDRISIKKNRNYLMLLDEASMLDTRTLAIAAAKIPWGGQLVLVGDPLQLQPVGSGTPLLAMIDRGYLNADNTTVLTEIHRSSESQELTEYQLRLRDSREVVDLRPRTSGESLLIRSVPSREDAFSMAKSRMERGDLIVTPLVRDALDLGHTYAEIRRESREAQGGLFGSGFSSTSRNFVAGDEVIITCNDLHRIPDPDGGKSGYAKTYNGQPATVVGWDKKAKGYRVKIDGVENEVIIREDFRAAEMEMRKALSRDLMPDAFEARWYPQQSEKKAAAAEAEIEGRVKRERIRMVRRGRSDEVKGVLLHRDALTVHKSQGSESDSVCLVLTETAGWMSRELFLVAATRAKKRLTIIYVDDQVDPEHLSRRSDVGAHRIDRSFDYINK